MIEQDQAGVGAVVLAVAMFDLEGESAGFHHHREGSADWVS